ncbi:MAG: TlpA disulfide reductase family protein [Actinomycetota bacterium]|nr:TlpA disulfide reductase family protein [Actinomycetota bacterium]
MSALGVYVVGALVFLALGGGRPESLGGRGDAATGPVHLVEYETLDGETTTLARYEGKPLILNFFASWCEPCVLEMPDFEAFHQDFADEYTVVGLAVEGARPAREIVAETGVTYDTGLDQRDIIVDMGGVGMPTTVFVSAEGVILDTHTGVLQYSDIVAKAEEFFGS